MHRKHPAFDPPEASVEGSRQQSETFELKRHFVHLNVYKLEIGEVKESQIVERTLPGGAS